ncbi:ATP-binding protein [Mucilaginibacter kameinonensis]|uniref:ATP-binding protein n=1 Tax=Mucilaginibacter kameinonensis TaxID=452286 RepID=UPI000EF81E0C|nr:ATP-binding protein [Mucilaginibacter kameinonensis]
MSSASQLLQILSLSDDATAVYRGENLIIEFANAAMLSFWGKDKSIVGLELEEAVPELKGQPFKMMLQAVQRTGISDEGIIPAQTSIHGAFVTRYYAYKYRAVSSEDGQSIYILHTASDVTERLRGEQAVRDMGVRDAELSREQQLNEELGSLNEELVATNEELVDTQSALAMLNASLEDKVRLRTVDLAESETKLQGLNEELSAINEELRATNEELLEIQASLQRSLTDLASVEHKVRSIVASAPFPIGVYSGREMLIELVNQSIIDVWGKGNDVVGKKYAEVLTELAGTGIYEQLDNVFTTGVPFQTRGQRVDLVVEGKLLPFYFNYNFTPLFDQDGRVYGVMNTAADVTDMVLARQQVEQSERNLHNIISQAPVAMCILMGPEHVVKVANALMIDLWGKSEAWVINLPILEALPDARYQGLKQILSDVYQKGQTYSTNETPVILLRNGREETVYQNFVYEPYRNANGEVIGVIVITIDVTDQVSGRLQTEENERRFRFLLNAMPQQVWTARADGSLDYVNDVVSRDFGENAEIIADQGWQGFVHPDDLPAALAKWRRSLQSGKEYLTEFRLRFADGNYYWHLARAVPLIEYNAVTFWLGTNTNIDQQKYNENRKDEFISIASHELKTPLTTIKAFFQLSKRESAGNGKLNPFAAKAERQMERLGRLIEDLLDVSKINAGKMTYNKEDFDFGMLLADTVENMQQAAPGHRIEISNSCSLIYHGDQHRLEQVLINLINNAVKYSPDADRVILNCERENQNIIVSVKDFGIGIAAEHLKGLFDRFYRVDNTSSRFQGLGLGLFIANEIVKRHGGSFWIESEPGEGSVFYFLLPLSGKQEFIDIAGDGFTYYDGSFIRIRYQQVGEYMDVDWLGYQNYDSVVKGCEILLDLMKKNDCQKVLNDNTHVKGNWSEASDWGAEVWFPAMAEAGLNKFAWIYSPSTFSRIAAKKSLPSAYEVVQVAFFDDKNEARDWLIS